MTKPEEKIKTRPELVAEVEELKAQGKKIVFTNGCFDLLHVGHVRYLKEAKKLGDILVLGLNSDISVQSLEKGEGRPFVPQDERAELLASLEMIDLISIFDEPTPLELIKLVHPDVLVKGGDWKTEDIIGGKEVTEWGGEVKALPEIPGKSTTNLLAKIARQTRTDVQI